MATNSLALTLYTCSGYKGYKVCVRWKARPARPPPRHHANYGDPLSSCLTTGGPGLRPATRHRTGPNVCLNCAQTRSRSQPPQGHAGAQSPAGGVGEGRGARRGDRRETGSSPAPNPHRCTPSLSLTTLTWSASPHATPSTCPMLDVCGREQAIRFLSVLS